MKATSHHIRFILDNQWVELDFQQSENIRPSTTLLNYLRCLPSHKGVKEGCAEGDCGACTVVVAELNTNNELEYKALDSCLVFLPMIHGKQIITIENLEQHIGKEIQLHPVQQLMVENNGSQCGYCTPGIVMSLFALYKNHHKPEKEVIEDALTGNLCRCTGYKPIIEAAKHACIHQGKDHFSEKQQEIKQQLLNIKKDNTSILLYHSEQLYMLPQNLNDALKLKKQYPNAVLIAGATDTALRQTKKGEIIPQIIDLSQVEELKNIEITDKSVIIGSSLPLEKLKSGIEKSFPALFNILKVFGSLQIRNIATMGGNIGSASPIGDTLPFLFACKAVIKLQSFDTKRKIPIEDFIIGYRKTAIKTDELIVAIEIPFIPENVILKSYKVSNRKDLDISTVSVCFRLQLSNDKKVKEIIIVYGGMAVQTLRAKKTEAFLNGKTWNKQIVETAMEILYNEFTPISDARSDKEYRKLACRNLLMKFWDETK
ncbi:MAG: xanthine dehydrogenase small subunit [Bacteroidetes bacterium]|nr:xanthine dehydrogenase small subunit [Bacteroidota bacterium]